MSELLPQQVAQLSAEQRRLLRLRLRQLKEQAGAPACFHELFEEQARRFPDRIAVIAGDTQLSYAALDQTANRLAHLLRDRGVGPETLVGLCVPRSPEMLVGLLAILKAGGAYVPLDPTYPPDRLAYMVADAGLPILLTRNSLLAMVPTGQASVLDTETLWPHLGQQPATPPASGVGADHLAYMIYTSGSTGQPKGVQITHRGIQAIPRWQHPNYGLDRPRRVLQGTSLSFDISVWEISAALLCGSTLVLPDPDLRMMGSDLQDLLVRQGVDTVILTPSALATLSEADLPAVRCITVGGEACPLDLVRTWAPGRAFFNGYGPTEATVGVCLARYEADLQRVHIGRAIPGAQLYVLDSRLQLLPIGVAGELCIGGSGLARGYLGRPDLTAATFLADPFSQRPGSRLYRTGDRVRLLPDGTIEFLGRIDEQIKIRGFRVELGEIESALSQHPDVLAAAVRLHEDRSAKRLIAYVVASEPVAPEDLRRFLGDRLPEYMVPSVFVPLDQLPINANGKLDRRALAALPWEQHAVVAQRQYIAPRTQVEEQLAAIWQDVLKTGGPVGIHDNFLALGGDSILSLQIIFRAKQLGWHFTAKQLFEHQTIAELGAVAVRQPVAAVEAEQGVVTGPVELTPIQRWFFGQRFARSQHWNQSAVLDVPAGLAPAQWERLLLRLLEQHDALRTRFIPDGDTWRAVLAAPGDRAPLEVCDLSAVPPQRRDEERAAAARRAQASLDLSTVPLLRAVLFTGSGGQALDRLLLVAHHLVIDVVSWHILLADLETLIERLRGGQDLTLPAKSSSWRRWAARLRQEATSATTAAELDYWREQTAATACSLPTDLPGQDNLTGHSQVCEVALDRAETEALLHDLPAAFETRVNEVLLTAVAAALGGWTQDTHVRIDVEGHGREDLFEEIDCSRTVGWFTTVSPLRLPVAAPHALGEGLKQIKELLRRRPRQGIGYGLLRYGPAQAGSAQTCSAQAGPAQAGSPLAEGAASQVSFNYLGQTDQSVTGGFAAASELAAPDLDPGNHRPYLVDLVSAVESGRLRMVWTYNETVHERATIEGVAQQTLEALRALVDHARRADLCTYTPSDVELSGLTQRQLDELVGQLRDLPAWRDGGQRPLEDCYPQTPVQRGLLFQSQYDRGQGLYHVQMILRIDEDLRLDAFRESWSRVMERHPILRTSFWEAGGGQALQLVWRRLPVPLEVVDWREHPAEHRQRLLQDHLSADRRQGFDAGAIPQWRMLLARTADECYQLVWSAHHAIVDGWSTSLLLSEMASGYGEIVSGNPEARLPVRPYRDYVAWLADQDMSQAERYWREVLHGVEQATGLSVERRPAPGAQDDAEPATQAWRSLFLTEAETAALQRLAQEHRVTLNTLMQGCWALLTSRYSRSEDVVFGVVVSGRPPEVDGVDRMIGLFINTLPLRVHVSGQERWLDWLRRLQEQNTGMRQYEYSPLNLVRQWGEIPADASLFDSLFVFENYPPDEHRATGLRFQDLGSEERTHYPLNLVITLEARLGLRILFDTRRFDEQTIATMLGHLRQICRELARSPHQLLAQVDLLTGAERSTLLGEWSATERTDPEPTYLHELVAQQVARTPDSVAVVDADQQLTYAELDRRANQLARWLQARGVGPDVLVGLCVERSIEVMIGLLGILKAGGGYVPLDPHHPQDRLAYLIDDARPRLLVTQSHLLATLPTGDLETLCLDGDWPLVALEPRTAPATTLTPDNLAYIIYTSGSTGKPKGVMVAHRCLGHIVPWQRGHPEFSRRQNVLQVASYSFDFSVWEIIMPLLTGGTLHIPRSDLHMIGMDLYQTLRDRAIENLNFTPAALATLPAEPLPHLRTLVVGGEAYSADLVRTWAPGRSFFNVYGPTETTVFATGTPIDEHLDVLHMGRPITNVRLYVLDEHLRPAPAGVPGELYIGGAGLTRGYLGRPDLTAETFIADPFGQEPGGRLYRSGDLVRYLPDGTIEFVGRVDHQVKIRGFRIELGEIEAALQQHPLVAGAAVLVQPEGASQRLVAYVVPVAAGTDPTEELRAHLEQQLPFYMIPTAFVCLDELPLTSNGKLNRRALPLPEATSPRALSERAVPRTRTEAVLATIWERILDRQPIGISDNFFALGGHSLLAVGVVARIRQAFGVQLPVRVLFEHPTIARVAEEIDRLREIQDPQETAPLVPVPRDQPLPATFDQQRLWFLDRLNPNSAFYTVGWLLHWPGAIETPTLRLALGALIERHETLRTTFSEDRGRVRQVIAPDAEVVLGEADLSAEAAGQRQASARKLVHEFWAEPFDLRHGPLVRTLLIRLSAEEAVVALSAHHTVIDGYSLRIFNQELRQLYRAAATGAPSGLPDLAVQYADYAVWQQQWLQEERLRSQLDYWKEQLADAPELITLPLDHPRPAVQSFRGATLGAALSRELTDLLRQVSTEHQTTHFITVLSAFAVLLSRYSGQDQVVLGVPIANRSRIETEPLIGFLVDTVALCVDLSEDPDFARVLQQVRWKLLDAQSHQEVPFERIVEELKPERSLSYSPVFQVMFTGLDKLFDETPDQDPEPAWLGEITDEGVGIAKFDLGLRIQEKDGELGYSFEYSTDLFEESTIARMGEHLRILLEQALACQHRPVSTLTMLTAGERTQILDSWNATADERLARPACLHDLFAEQAARTPDRIAVSFADQQLTYAGLDRRANQLARALRRLGVGPESRVGICAERSLELEIGLLAILKAGGAYVPLDPGYPAERLAYMVADAKVGVVLVQAATRARIEPLAGPDVPLVECDADALAVLAESAEPLESGTRPENLAYVIYTSGSTGKPKGAMLTHHGICNRLLWMQEAYRLRPSDRVLQKTPFSFDVSVWEFFWPVIVGAQLHLARPEGHRDPAYLVELIRRQGIGVLHFVPSMLQTFLEQPEVTEACAGVRHVVCSGEALPLDVQDRCLHRLPGARLHNLYGPTEASVDVTFWECRSSEHATTVPIGLPVANTQLYVLDAAMQPVPQGVIGQLHLAGVQLARGYLGRPDLTAERFVANPFGPGRLYATGDLARFGRDGVIEYVGRKDHQIKIRGHRIEVDEIEAVLAQHPAVDACLVVVHAVSEADKRLAAFYTATGGTELDAAALREHLGRQLPEYMIPSYLVWLPAFPLSANGKIDRKALPSLTEVVRARTTETFVAPRTETERTLAGIWARLLGVERIGADDDFFDLGGHSLLVASLATEVQTLWDVSLMLPVVFQNRTLTALAGVIDDSLAEGDEAELDADELFNLP